MIIKNLADYLARCPGFVGEIARGVNNTLRYSRPEIALPAALCFCAAVKSGRVVSALGVECSLYTFALAGPGSGKTQIQNRLEDISHMAEIKDLFGFKPTCDSALITGLISQPRQLLMMDEFGEALDDLANGNNALKATVLTAMLEAFSCAGRTMRGNQYADGKRKEAHNVYLSVFGVSNSYSFSEAMTERFIHNGFLSRFLGFVGEGKQYKQAPKPLAISAECIDWLKGCNIWTAAKGDIGIAKHKQIVNLEANKLYQNCCNYFEGILDDSKSEIHRIFWSRSIELFTKLCLIFHEENPVDTNEIEGTPIFWCMSLTEYLINAQVKRCLSHVKSPNKAKIVFQDLLGVGQQIAKSELTYQARNLALSKNERDDMIKILLESGAWEEFEQHLSTNSNRKATFYKRLK